MNSNDDGDDLRKALDIVDDWVLPPLVFGDWIDLSTEEREDLLKSLRSIRGEVDVAQLPFNNLVERIRIMPTSFYSDWMLAEAQAETQSGRIGLFAFLFSNSECVLLDGKSLPIHQLNALTFVPPKSEREARDYLKFFCAAVRAEKGPFEIVESVDCLRFTVDAEARIKDVANDVIHEIAIETKEDGESVYTATVLHANALFMAEFQIRDNGSVEMLDDEPLITELPLERIEYQEHFRFPC